MSRGIDRIVTVPLAGSTWMILTTSLRWPDTDPVEAPVCLATGPESPARESEPIERMLKGWFGTGYVIAGHVLSVWIWSKRHFA